MIQDFFATVRDVSQYARIDLKNTPKNANQCGMMKVICRGNLANSCCLPCSTNYWGLLLGVFVARRVCSGAHSLVVQAPLPLAKACPIVVLVMRPIGYTSASCRGWHCECGWRVNTVG